MLGSDQLSHVSYSSPVMLLWCPPPTGETETQRSNGTCTRSCLVQLQRWPALSYTPECYLSFESRGKQGIPSSSKRLPRSRATHSLGFKGLAVQPHIDSEQSVLTTEIRKSQIPLYPYILFISMCMDVFQSPEYPRTCLMNTFYE